MRWIKNSDGKPDAMLTLTMVSFIVVMVKIMFGGTSINIGSFIMSIDAISPELAATLLGTNTAGYVFRRHTDKKFEAKKEDKQS